MPSVKRLAVLVCGSTLLLYCSVQCFTIGYADFVYNSDDIQSVQAALRISPENAEYHRRYAFLLSADPAMAEARLRELRASLELNPRDSRVWGELATLAEVE